MIPLDIFKKTMQNKFIETLQEAWLTSLSEDDPQRLQGFETLAGSKVSSFRVCGKDSPDAKEKLKKLAEEIKQYVEINSYGQEYT